MDNDQIYIDEIIEKEIKDFSEKFKNDYCTGKAKKKVNILNKKNNLFIAALGDEIAVYSALMRSLDSSLGNRLERIAKLIAAKHYIVENGVKGHISVESINAIANLLESYHNHGKKPEATDLESVYKAGVGGKNTAAHEVSDYFLTLRSDPHQKFLIELKIGGDLDNKKAESEKRALLQQYVVLRNGQEINEGDNVKIFFCTAYNKNGEDAHWTQERVRQFFSDSEIMIGKDFWNLICNSDNGYNLVKASYLKHAHYLKDALQEIVAHFASL